MDVELVVMALVANIEQYGLNLRIVDYAQHFCRFDLYRPLVKQMIMGAGKTTVVGPLLAMMLSDGSNLVIQVVPPALLDFTRNILRTTFSSVLQKQIYTFHCDRAYEVDAPWSLADAIVEVDQLMLSVSNASAGI